MIIFPPVGCHNLSLSYNTLYYSYNKHSVSLTNRSGLYIARASGLCLYILRVSHVYPGRLGRGTPCEETGCYYDRDMVRIERTNGEDVDALQGVRTLMRGPTVDLDP